MGKAEHGTLHEPVPVNLREVVQLANSSLAELKNHVSWADTDSALRFPQQHESDGVEFRNSRLGVEHPVFLLLG